MNEDKTKNVNLFQTGAGNMIASMVIAGFLLGYFVDRWLDLTPLFMFLLGALGFVGGMMRVFKLLKSEENHEHLFEEKDPNPKNSENKEP